MKRHLFFWKRAVATICVTTVLAPAILLAGAPKARHENGTIKSIDSGTHTLVVAGTKENSQQKFQWNDSTTFMEHGKAVTVGELKEGMRVSITYRAGGDTPTMENVRLTPAKS